MADPARARKLAKRISQIVASALEHEVKDPRLAMVTITDTKVTPDLHDATVYYTVFGDDADFASTAAALASCTGVLRSKVGAQTGVKFTPTLKFIPDAVPTTAKAIDELLARAKDADAEVARLAANAAHAGDADPYKAPKEEEDE
ncbi:30S ribosome-binding factor RbfA [Pseudonocardiaceae bacterium YIM PH 21723]|nr:30S ribosome-binding factor RbfA [Pseudonocardiaceae bacterium YIM PH 21723]